jgi:putative addiction module killer protein
MEIQTYATSSGRIPYDDWYLGLDLTASLRVARAIERLKQGNFSNVKGVGSGVMEFRIDFGPGYRVYFGLDGQELVLLLTGGDKRRQQRDIDAAIEFWNDYRRRKRESRRR